MSLRQAFASVLHLFVLVSFFVAGIFFIGLSRLPELRERIFKIEDFTEVGLMFFAASVLLFLGFFALNHGKYLRIRMGIDVHVKVIRQTIEEVFQARKIPLHDVGVFRHSLEISVSMKKEDEPQLSEIEKELGLLLRKRFGYTKPFYVVVHRS